MGKEQNAQQSDIFMKGFEAGQMTVQPNWVSVTDALPEEEGDYYTISEALKDYPAGPKGTICVNISDSWNDGKWWQDDEFWRVLYWARPIQLGVPAVLAERPRIGCI